MISSLPASSTPYKKFKTEKVEKIKFYTQKKRKKTHLIATNAAAGSCTTNSLDTITNKTIFPPPPPLKTRLHSNCHLALALVQNKVPFFEP